MKIKRLCAVLLAAILCLAAVPASVSAGGDGVYETWDFDGHDSSDWTFIDADGDGENFEIKPYEAGNFALVGVSYEEVNGVAYAPDNYAVSPEIQLPNAGDELYLKWTVFSLSPYYSNENYSVYVYSGTEELSAQNVGTLLSEAAFTETLPDSCTTKFVRFLDLSAYIGQKIRVVFRHHNSEDTWAFGIDEITVTDTGFSPHIHQWANYYSCNKTHHWYNCTANGCTALGFESNEGYSEHDFKTYYNFAYHWVTCETCGYSTQSDYLRHSYTVKTDGDYTYFHCSECGVTYDYLADTLIDYPIVIDGSEFAGCESPVPLEPLGDELEYAIASGIDYSNVWNDCGYLPVSEFLDGETYIFILALEAKDGFVLPLDAANNAVKIEGVQWAETYSYLTEDGLLMFEGVIVYDSETGILGGEVIAVGDVNGDGYIDSIDASLILQYDAGIIDEIQNADFNGDGVVDSLDAARILQYDAGLI